MAMWPAAGCHHEQTRLLRRRVVKNMIFDLRSLGDYIAFMADTDPYAEAIAAAGAATPVPEAESLTAPSPSMDDSPEEAETANQIYERIDRELTVEEARADRLLRLYGL
jgi:hypothetical protein